MYLLFYFYAEINVICGCLLYFYEIISIFGLEQTEIFIENKLNRIKSRTCWEISSQKELTAHW